ncbi:macrophage mannose receptor 1-like isoform X2 [Danio rerio]|uniref:Macrophage mannose receptor 1-like isoform X2 n=1 Tax=Danio rerio TaxID=7955 RepID=A0AC58G2F4_DANRE
MRTAEDLHAEAAGLETMEHTLLPLLIFIGVCASPVFQQEVNVFYAVSTEMSFSEAQQYCRQTYTDMASFESMEDLRALDTDWVPLSGAWIGLKDASTQSLWHWAIADPEFYAAGETDYRNWDSFQPAIKLDCVVMTSSGYFKTMNCLDFYYFICYDETSMIKPYVLIDLLYTWREAQRYCRRYYTDLVSVRNRKEIEQIKKLIPLPPYAYIGLFRDTFLWSSNSTSSLRNWDLFQPDIIGDCVAMLDDKYWMTELCSKAKPFYCYHRELAKKRQIVKLELKFGVNVKVNDPIVNTAILSKIQQKLQDLGVENITSVEWRKADDGTVFQKSQNETIIQQERPKR